MTKYQLLFIIDIAAEDDAKKALIEKFTGEITSLGGNVVTVDEWGKRRYAYPINHKKEGYYVLVVFEGASDIPAELDRKMRINDQIVRQMITKL
jgi:small subunit ribosomal protein S6